MAGWTLGHHRLRFCQQSVPLEYATANTEWQGEYDAVLVLRARFLLPLQSKVPGSLAFLTLLMVGFSASAVGEDKQLLWGDTHLHSTYSSDAFSNGNLTATPDAAYRYAKGMPVVHPGHKEASADRDAPRFSGGLRSCGIPRRHSQPLSKPRY